MQEVENKQTENEKLISKNRFNRCLLWGASHPGQTMAQWRKWILMLNRFSQSTNSIVGKRLENTNISHFVASKQMTQKTGK